LHEELPQMPPYKNPRELIDSWRPKKETPFQRRKHTNKRDRLPQIVPWQRMLLQDSESLEFIGIKDEEDLEMGDLEEDLRTPD
jgi:hypothetical protein